jgi:hypothetical protein
MRSVAGADFEREVDAPATGAVLATAAAGLLGRPALGVTRVRVIGLPERQVVHFAVAGAALGLRCETTRTPHGHLAVALAPPVAEPAEAARRRGASAGVGRLRRWLRALARRGERTAANAAAPRHV